MLELQAHNLGQLLTAVRARHGWSVEAAAKVAGIGHMTWRRVESGQPVRLRTFAAIDRLLERPAGTVLTALRSDEHMAELYQAVTGIAPQQPQPIREDVLAETEPERPLAGAAAPMGRRPQPIRSTMDLPPDEHAEFLKFAVDASTATGLSVRGQNVLRALVRRVLTDRELAGQIIRDLSDGNGKA